VARFYDVALPKSGVYCVSTIDKNKSVINRFAESVDEVYDLIEQFKFSENDLNIFVAPASFKNFSRKADNAEFVKSLFIDLDIGDGKAYSNQQEALDDLQKFVDYAELPPPVRINSGRGIHAYWLMDSDIPAPEWRKYAKKFKEICIEAGLKIDPAVTADAARIMRAPDTLNYKSEPPLATSLIDEEFIEYDFSMFKEFLGEVDVDVEDILNSASKGLDEETKKLLKLDNFQTLFSDIVNKTLEGDGCAQVLHCIENAKTLPEPMWYAILSIARHCEDWEEAIHVISEDHPEYSYENTIRKANQSHGKPQGCEVFNSLNPGKCDGCPYRGKITNPLAIGRTLKEVSEEVQEAQQSQGGQEGSGRKKIIPKALYPYTEGVNGGVYFVPEPTVTKDGKKIQDSPIQLTPYDLYPIKRMYSESEGEALRLRFCLPKDPTREFTLLMKDVSSHDKLREALSKKGILFPSNLVGLFDNYFKKWGAYMIEKDAAELTRMQMGFTEDRDAFVIGNTEIRRDGRVLETPASPMVRNVAKLLRPVGSYDTWKQTVMLMDKPGFELHAFTLFTAFGSPLMHMTSTSGVAFCLTGPSGSAKTGALYSALSVFGQPRDLSVFDATDNGMIGRFLGLHNIILGCDEVSNKDGKILSNLIHRVSHGKSKIRMQASQNAERDLEMSASLICCMTSNQSIYDKLTEFKTNPDGEAARLVEFTLSPPPLLADEKTGAKLGKKMFDPFNYNYGHAGPEYIKHLFKVGDDRIIELLNKWSQRFQDDFGAIAAYRFYENKVAASFTGAELAKEAGIHSLNIDRVYAATVAHMISIRDNTIRVNFVDYKSMVGEFVDNYHGQILIIDGERVVEEPHSGQRLVARSEVHNKTIFISKTAFKEFLSKRQISSRQFEKAMEGDGLLAFNGKGRLSTGWKNGIQSPPIYIYGFKYDSGP